MDQHINVSEKYPQVTLNTTYSFGIGDQDFMLAFECDNLRDFQNLIMDLRQTPVSAYIAVDTPMITCVKKRHCSYNHKLGMMNAFKGMGNCCQRT